MTTSLHLVRGGGSYTKINFYEYAQQGRTRLDKSSCICSNVCVLRRWTLIYRKKVKKRFVIITGEKRDTRNSTIGEDGIRQIFLDDVVLRKFHIMTTFRYRKRRIFSEYPTDRLSKKCLKRDVIDRATWSNFLDWRRRK